MIVGLVIVAAIALLAVALVADQIEYLSTSWERSAER